MATLLKAFLRGLMYLFALPFLLVLLSIYSIIGIVVFIYTAIKGIFLFFTGRNVFGDLPEDVKAREILYPKTPKEPVVEQVEKKEEPVNNSLYTTQFYIPGSDINVDSPIKEQPVETEIIHEDEIKEEPVEIEPFERPPFGGNDND